MSEEAGASLDANASLDDQELLNGPEGDHSQASESQESEAESSSAADESSNTEDVSRETDSIQRRFDELTRNWREEQRRSERLMAMLERQREEVNRTPEPQEDGLKGLKDFDYDEAKYYSYLEDRAAKRAEKAAQSATEVIRKEMQQAEANRRWETRQAEYAKQHKDYFEVINRPWSCSQPMAEAIKESDEGPAIAEHLAKNPDLAARMSELGPIQAAREIGKIEARIVADRTKPKDVSKAPPPPPKVEGAEPGLRVDTTSAESDKLSDSEWIKAEAARMARKAKRK